MEGSAIAAAIAGYPFVLAAQHGLLFLANENTRGEFKNSEEYNSLICAEDFRVLRCNEREAKVYYYSSFSGNIFYFEKDGEDWVYAHCETLWSSMGSADDYIWPYWWHSLFVRDWH